MAENDRFRTAGMYWSVEEDAEHKKTKQETRKKRPNTLGRKTNEVKADVPKKTSQPTVQEVQNQSSHDQWQKKASLKDLCLEDKTRVASLIKELSRLGEEKETVTELLNKERELFEAKINDIISQQGKIIQERTEIEKQLQNCQELIVKYQKVIRKKEADLVSASTKSKLKSENTRPNKTKQTQFIKPTCPPDLPQLNIKEKIARFSTMPSPYPDQDRPFTAAIDKLIHDEKNKSLNSHITEDDRELKLGPLVNPNFESTQISNDDTNSENIPEFRPLHSDLTTPCPSDNNSQLPELFETSDKLVSNQEDYSQHTISDSQKSISSSNTKPFANYRQLKPEEMKNQLSKQKQALIEEQERLKMILSEQETLLVSKQHQLWKQQEIQRNRLQHFEQTGHFPGSDNNNYIGNQFQTNPVNMMNMFNGLMNNHSNYSSIPNVNHQVPIHIPNPNNNNPYFSHGSAYTNLNDGFHLPVTNLAVNDVGFTRPTYSPATKHIHQPAPRKEPVNTLTPSIHASTVRNTGRKECTASYGDEKVVKLLDIVDEVDSLYAKSSDVDSLKPYLMPTRGAKQDMLRDPFSEDGNQEEDYLDISGCNKRSSQINGGYYSNGRKSSVENDFDCSDEFDESQVLEDVFFIK